MTAKEEEEGKKDKTTTKSKESLSSVRSGHGLLFFGGERVVWSLPRPSDRDQPTRIDADRHQQGPTTTAALRFLVQKFSYILIL